jgi:hypothetical protein
MDGVVQGHKVVELGYLRLLGDVARAADRGEESGNLSQVGRVHWEYDIDWQTDRVTRDSQGK